LADLGCQFTCRGEDETEQRLRLVEKSLEDGKSKGSCLSTTCFGETDNVTAFESDGDGLFLDGRGVLVVELFASFAESVDNTLTIVRYRKSISSYQDIRDP
jgi:hypothetical protein